MNALEAISRLMTAPQFFERDSVRARAYSCTFGFRCAKRFSTDAMTFRALSPHIITQTFRKEREKKNAPFLPFIRDFIAQIENKLPILARQILVRRLACRPQSEPSKHMHRAPHSPTISSYGFAVPPPNILMWKRKEREMGLCKGLWLCTRLNCSNSAFTVMAKGERDQPCFGAT